jgi:hypothetical protein
MPNVSKMYAALIVLVVGAVLAVWLNPKRGHPDTLGVAIDHKVATTSAFGSVSAPTIVWGAPIPHSDRGVCTNCHGILTKRGLPVPMVYSFSRRPHEYRGVCENCHTVGVKPSARAGTQVGLRSPLPSEIDPAAVGPVSF